MNGPNQDVIFYRDGSIINDTVLERGRYLLMVLYTLGTAPTWLVAALIENAAVLTATQINRSLTKRTRQPATVVSFNNTREFYAQAVKQRAPFNFVDGFSELFTKRITDPERGDEQVRAEFEKLTKDLSGVVIIEGFEIFAQATNASTHTLTALVQALVMRCQQVIVVMPEPTGESRQLMINLLYRAHLVCHTRPLETGRAKDITGSLTVTRGPVPAPVPVAEQEYLYNVDATSVKVALR